MSRQSGAWTLLLAVAMSGAVLLSACGKKASPLDPEGTTYPRSYPNPNTTLQGSTSTPAAHQEPYIPPASAAPVSDESEDEGFFFERTKTRTFITE